MKLSIFRIASAALLCLFAGARIASADTLTLTYYNIAANDPDANHLGSGLVGNEVGPTLGTNGLPVLNLHQYTGCTTTCFALTAPGVDTSTSLLSDGEITYWDPAANPNVTREPVPPSRSLIATTRSLLPTERVPATARHPAMGIRH